MSGYLMDTSALVKYYHREPGSEQVIQLFGQQDAVLLISDLTIIETYSALGKKVRIGALILPTYERSRLRFEADVASGKLLIIQVMDRHKQVAIDLLKKHAPIRALRTLDALQLAVAAEL